MDLPAWNDPDLNVGTMVKAGLWLIQAVGEGNTFTKEQLRDAFPGVTQVDRRVRDLRAYGWTILSSTEDAALMSEEQRFVRVGTPVWDPAARRAATSQKALPAKEIKAIHARDDFMCTSCGIAGGEPYVDDPSQTAVLSVTRRETVLPDGRQKVLYVTECKRCRAGSDGSSARADEIVADIKTLDPADRRRLSRWIERGRRGSTPLERVWNAYRRLPPEAREEVRSVLES